MSEPSPTPKGVTIPRGALIGGGVVLVVLLIGVAVLVGIMIGGNDAPAAEPSSAPTTSERPTTEPKVSEPAPPPAESEPDTYRVGDTFTTGNVTLTIHSVEVTGSIATTDGSQLTPDAGGQLLLIKSTYSNSKTQADLSCGNTDLYIQVFDTEEREMAPVFDPPVSPETLAATTTFCKTRPTNGTSLFSPSPGHLRSPSQ